MRHPLILIAALLSTPLLAEEVPPPPPMPDSLPSATDEELQPEVTIIRRGRDIIEEYRVNGQVYMVKISPSKGKPYYLVDSDGDGSLETRRNELDNPEIVQWRIFTW